MTDSKGKSVDRRAAVKPAPDAARTMQAAVLAWILPGAGHFYLGHRGLAAVFFIAISFPFWTGVALGGVKDSVNPRANKWLFLAEMCSGGYTTVCFIASNQITARIQAKPPAERAKAAVRYTSYFPESDVAQIYLATAGLLNLLAVLDALARAQNGGLPTFAQEAPAPSAAGGGKT